jgi:hypothetical protein
MDPADARQWRDFLQAHLDENPRLTQNVEAARIGAKKKTFSNWIRGKSFPSRNKYWHKLTAAYPELTDHDLARMEKSYRRSKAAKARQGGPAGRP